MTYMTKEGTNSRTPSMVRLTYRKGEPIVKEGDFGISIYRITKGAVQIFNQSEEREITLAILRPGEFISEMDFLSKEIEVRSASARAVQDSELEVWHPEAFREECDTMAPVIKHMTREVHKRLVRLNKFIVQMTASQQDESEKTVSEDNKENGSKRIHYRKDVDLTCVYRPVDSPAKLQLNGSIKNISMTGINMEARVKNAVSFTHDPGDEFSVELTLPNGKEVRVTARIQVVREPRVPGTMSLGMVFTDMREGATKALGFFLMP